MKEHGFAMAKALAKAGAVALVLCAAMSLPAAIAGTPVDQGSPGSSSWLTATKPQTCNLLLPDAGTAYFDVTVGTGAASTIPATGGGGNGANPNRKYIVICNSAQNATLIPAALVKCRSDGVAPVMAVGNVGEVLGVGDCVPYAAPVGKQQPIKCIADTASTHVNGFECI